jgi:hypothetical protein
MRAAPPSAWWHTACDRKAANQEGIALIQQIVRDPSHLPVPPERYDEVGASSC